MIYFIVLYTLAFIATATTVGTLSYRSHGKIDWIASVTSGLIWPLWWTLLIVSAAPPMRPAKCAWCGKEVARMAYDPDTMKIWRKHYLEDCGCHPLQEDQVVYENYQKDCRSEMMNMKPLPDLSCGECMNFVKCEAIFQCEPASTECDFYPIKFVVHPKKYLDLKDELAATKELLLHQQTCAGRE